MANTKITALTQGTPVATDLLPYVSAPGGAAVTQQTTLQLAANVIAGLIGAATLINVASASALVVGPNGATNPTLQVVTNVASAITGLSITGNATGAGVTLTALGGTNEGITLTPKGTGNVKITSGFLGIGVTPTYGLHIAPTSGLTAAQTVFIQDATGSTGATKMVLKAGAGQSTTSLLEFQNNAGSVGVIITTGYVGAGASGSGLLFGSTVTFQNTAGTVLYGDMSTTGLVMKQAGIVGFSASASNPYSTDTAFSRLAAGVIGVGTGAQGSFAGTIKATHQLAANAVTGLSAGALAALTNASLVLTDASGQVYRVPCII